MPIIARYSVLVKGYWYIICWEMEVAMSTLYDRIIWACNKRGVTPSLMCDTIGIRRAFASELKTRIIDFASEAKKRALERR